MTETIFAKGDITYKLECRLSLNSFNRSYSYLFKLMQRGKGKRKWCDISGYENQYRANTDIKDILKYLTKDEIMETAVLEHNNHSPSEKLIFNSQI